MKCSRKRSLFLLLCTCTAVLTAHPKAGVTQTTGNITIALAELERNVADTMERTKVPGVAVAVVYRDNVVFLKGYGVKALGQPGKVDPDTVFEIASFSKPIASTIVAEVVGRGDVSWESRIAKLDPEFKLNDPAITAELTVRDLLAHRSTLPGESGDALEALGYTRPEILSRLQLVNLQGTFRKTYQYSNFGITEGSLAATRHLGGTWEEVANNLLYSKLGMRSTSSRFTDYFNHPNRASLHYLDESGVFHNRYLREADAESPAGGVSSSARDLAQWLRLQLAGGAYNGKRIVDRRALEETHKAQVCRNPEAADGSCPNNSFYGLGWNVDSRASGEKQLSHSGAFMMGAATTVYMIPDRQIGILVLSNGSPVGLPETVALNFLDAFENGAPKHDYLSLLEDSFTQLRQGVMGVSKNYSMEAAPASASAGQAPASLAGSYANSYYGQLEVAERQGRLTLRLPPLGTYFELSHWDGDTYTYYIENEVNGAARRGVKFSADGNQVTVENLKLEYSNVFQRVH